MAQVSKEALNDQVTMVLRLSEKEADSLRALLIESLFNDRGVRCYRDIADILSVLNGAEHLTAEIVAEK